MKKAIYFFVLVTVALSCKKNDEQVHPPLLPELVLDSLKILSADIPLADYTDLTFLDADLGYAISNDGLVIQTTDGGLHWQQLIALNVYLHKVQFVNKQTGYIIGGDLSKAYLFKTTDAGLSWQKTVLDTPLSGWATGMFFLNANTGFITGQYFFRKTTDGGKTWTDIVNNPSDNFIDVQFRNEREGYATANEGRYYRTVNGGQSWTMQTAKSTEHLREIFISPSRVYAKAGAALLVELTTGNIAGAIPSTASKMLFLTDEKCVGIGQHYEAGFWPYGDIFLTNNTWSLFVSRKFAPEHAVDFNAIARVGAHKTIIIGGGHLQTTVVQLNH